MTTTTQPARIAYALTVYATRAGRALVGDGQERFWCRASALEQTRTPADDLDADEGAARYAAWCRGAEITEAAGADYDA